MAVASNRGHRRRDRFAVTAGGRAVLLLAATGLGLGVPLRWIELRYLGVGALAAVLACAVAVLWPTPGTGTVAARPARTAVGGSTVLEIALRSRLVPLHVPLVRLEGEVAAGELRVRTLWPGRTRTELIEHVAQRRGVFTIGPVLHLQSDPLGLFRRTRRWGESSTLWVRPRVVVPESFTDGGVFDLEGLASEQISVSDLAFHALREYVPGDDLRRVHWRSSAKAGELQVRQYHESRSLNAAVLVDDDPRSYADPEEFETAISVAASLSIRALSDGFDVRLGCGTRITEPPGREALLDETCVWELAPPRDPGTTGDVVARAAALARSGSAVGVGVVVSGARCDRDRLLEATASFGGEARRIAARVDRAGAPTVRTTHGVHVLELARVDDLPRLASWVAG